VTAVDVIDLYPYAPEDFFAYFGVTSFFILPPFALTGAAFFPF